MLNKQLFESFDPISLDEVNKKAALLQRKDNKYLVSAGEFLEILREAGDEFDVLTISGERMFAYSTLYYDDENYQCYLDHHNGRRIRAKVRERLYEQSEAKYLEVKLKSTRKSTVKFRYGTREETLPCLTEDRLAFVNQTYFGHYSRAFEMDLTASLAMRYHRFTLVGKNSSERVTVDSQLCFVGKTSLATVRDHQIIVEVKSRNGAGVFDRLFRKRGVRPKKRLSKYCLGLCLTDKPARNNNFLKPLRGLKYSTRPNGYQSIQNALLEVQGMPEAGNYVANN